MQKYLTFLVYNGSCVSTMFCTFPSSRIHEDVAQDIVSRFRDTGKEVKIRSAGFFVRAGGKIKVLPEASSSLNLGPLPGDAELMTIEEHDDE
jgi:hypothetical protein